MFIAICISSLKMCLLNPFSASKLGLFSFLLLSSKCPVCMTGYICRFRIDLCLCFNLLFSVVNKSHCLVEGSTKYFTTLDIVQLTCSLFKQLFI